MHMHKARPRFQKFMHSGSSVCLHLNVQPTLPKTTVTGLVRRE